MPVCLEVPRGKRQQESLQVVLAVEKKRLLFVSCQEGPCMRAVTQKGK